MLRDQGLFSQVISWDSRYTDFYSQRGAQEEWCTARSRLQSHSKEFGPLETRRDFFFSKKHDSKIKQGGKGIGDTIEGVFLLPVERDAGITLLQVTYLVTPVRTYQVNLMMIIRSHSPMDDRLHQPHEDKSIFNAHWGDNINAPVKAKMRKLSRINRVLVEELNYSKQEWLICCQQIIKPD